MRNMKGITLITVIVTIIVLLILTGVTIGVTINHQGIIDKAVSSKEKVEKETLIQKLEADIFEEKTIKNRNLTETEIEEIIKKYGKIEERDGRKLLISTEGNYEIYLEELSY